MNIELNTIITLENGEEYLTIDKVTKDKADYYYIAQLNEEKNDIANNYKVVIIKKQDGKDVIEEVLGEDNLKEVLPLFIDKIKE